MYNDLSLMHGHIKKMSNAFKTGLLLLTLAELVLIIRGLLFFNLERLKLRFYLYSYIFLFATSLAALLIFCLCGAREKHLKKTVTAIYLYSFCLILWSAGVSSIDCYANGDSGLMVYIMTSIAVGALTLIKPWVFFVYMSSSGVLIAVLTAMVRNWQPYSSGFYINFVVFLITTVLINNHSYRLSKREHEAAQQLEKLSYTDQLTNLYNRRQLETHISDYLKGDQPFIFVLLDIDDFKLINDRHGHPAGDRCLVMLAELLKECFGNQVYRFGGDELAIIPTLGLAETCETLDEINRRLGSSDTISMHVSAGVYAASPTDTATAIFSRTDNALYRAKSLNKARWVLYE